MNQSQPEQAIKIDSQHWIHLADTETNLQAGLTAHVALDDAFMSIASRIYLIRNARQHIDLQYYIWKDDFIGNLMLSELLDAADRGVKVRLLIDDHNGTQLDQKLISLSQHPNFQVKLFNPYKYRHFRVFDYLFRLKQINHRMHNKLIIADGAIAVTGGRNISSEYFDASDEYQFTDLDILFYGTAVKDANNVYQQFWNDDLSYPVQQLIHHQVVSLAQLKSHFSEQTFNQRQINNYKLEETQTLLDLELKKQSMIWSKAHFVADSPKKILGQAQGDELIYNQMFQLMGKPSEQLELVSAYFVPTKQGTEYLSSLTKNDVGVRVLTNSFFANDVAVVHAFYQKYRKDLLKSGVQLYEFKPYIYREKLTWYEVITGNIIPAKGKNNSRLHAKFFDIDGKVFIGSFNFDPRSAHLNTEVGLVIESESLQRGISTTLNEYLPKIAYQLTLDEHENIIWLEHLENGQVLKHVHEPETNKFQRFMIQFVSILPIEWLM